MTQMTQNSDYENLSALEKFQVMLEYTGRSSYLLSPPQQSNFDQLLIPIAGTSIDDIIGEGPENENAPHPHFIQTAFVNDMLEALAKESNLEVGGIYKGENESIILQFSVQFGIQVPETQMVDMTKILSLFTQLTPFGSFGMIDDNLLFYRYCWVLESKDMPMGQAVKMIEVMAFFIETFLPGMDAIAQGQKSVEEVSQEAMVVLSASQG